MRASLAPVLGLLLAVAVAADEQQPQLEMVWTETPPVIDGELNDPVWQQGALVDHFIQVTPVQGAAPSQRTEIRVLSDSENLYFGVRCYDTEIDKAVINRMNRDAFLFYDDRFQIALDPFHDRQNGYSFEVNPAGGRRDVLIEGNAFSLSWDTIWYAKTSIDANGWSAEIQIPYQSLNYNPDSDTWGINFSRGIRRNNEESRWADPYPQRFLADLGNAGVVSGMRGKRGGIGLDISPGLTFKYLEDPSGDFDFEPSGDIFFKVLPSLTLSATGNTNFGETEADQRTVNFSRFAIAFPEKRDFFLQDALIFEFAELTDDFSGIPDNGQPFFSRRIGISQPDPDLELFEPVKILGGGKITGRIDNLKVGAIHTLVEDVGDVDEQHLSVGRVALNVLGESTVGLIATHGDPLGQVDNTVVGGDFVYRDTNFLGEQNLRGIAWFQHSFTQDHASDAEIKPWNGNEHAYSLGLSYPNDRIRWRAQFTEIAGSFNPALGFLNRGSIREYEFDFRHRVRRSGYLRIIDHGVETALVTDLGDDIESAKLRLLLVRFENELAGQIRLNFQHTYERPLSDFDLPGGVRVDDRGLHFEEAALIMATTRNRALFAEFTLAGGEYFEGTRLIVRPNIEWRPSVHFLFGLRYEFRQIDLPFRLDDRSQPASATNTIGGKATTHILSGRVGFFFTPNISWTTLVQWDNVTNNFDINSRLRWIVEDGREIFIVLNQGFKTRVVRDDGTTQRTRAGLQERRTQPLIKISWNFRF